MTRMSLPLFGKKIFLLVCLLAIVLGTGIHLVRHVLKTEIVIFVRTDDTGVHPSDACISRRTIARSLKDGSDALRDSAAVKIRTLAVACGIPEEQIISDASEDGAAFGYRIDFSARWLQHAIRRLRNAAGRPDDLIVDFEGTDNDTTLHYTVCRLGGRILASGPIGLSELHSADNPLAETLCASIDPVAVLMKNYEHRPTDAYMERINRIRLYEAAESFFPVMSRFSGRKNGPSGKRLGTAMGIVCESFGRTTGDTGALHRAAGYYASSSMPFRTDTVERLADSCMRVDPDAFIGRFLNEQVRLPDSCRQLILVYNDRPERVSCIFRRYEKQDGKWRDTASPVRCNVGRNGLAPYREKREGDGRTPSGAYPMGFAFGYAADIETAWPFLVVTKNHFWISDPDDPAYNRMTTVHPDTEDFEYLRRDDDAYKYAAVVEYNMHPVEKYMGSAIFFHVESGFDRGSAGCITVTETETVEVLRWLAPGLSPYMLIGTLPGRFDSE